MGGVEHLVKELPAAEAKNVIVNHIHKLAAPQGSLLKLKNQQADPAQLQLETRSQIITWSVWHCRPQLYQEVKAIGN